MKKRILFVPSWYPSESDGISGIFIQEQAVALSKHYDVAVLIPRMAAWRNVLNTAVEKSFKASQEGLPVYWEYALPLIPHGPEANTYQTFVRAARQGLRKVVKEWGRPDVIHAHVVIPGGWSALALSRESGIPSVLTEHSSPFSMHLGTELSRRIVHETLDNVDKLIAISPALVKQILAFHPGAEIEVIGESVRTDFFVAAERTVRERTTGTSFFIVARLAEQKGLTYLLEAVQLLLKRGLTSFELVLGGDGPDRAKLEQMAQTLGVSDHCRFLGALTREQVRDRMQQSDVFVLSSLHETFGVVVGEAMACGKPVICTRCGGPEFIVNEQNGVLVDVANAGALADAMADFMAGRAAFDPATVRASVVDRFSPEAFARNVSAVYEQLLARGRSR